MATAVTELAPAKLNLYLRVLGRRIDGYHLIDSVMVPLNLRDRVRVIVRSRCGPAVRVGLVLRGRTGGVATGRRNLASRAVRAFLGAACEGGNVAIVLHKDIPAASGLGGGSSDAAAVLRAMARLYPGRLSAFRLAEIARDLGADVPFFMRCRPARVRGIGEQLAPFRGRVPPWFVVVVPRPGVSTASAYRALRLTRGRQGSRLSRPRYSVSHPVNDLERAVLPRRPDIGRIKGCLLDAGAQMALMSGSGSAVFGSFASRGAARAAATRMPRGARVFVVRSLASLPAGRGPAGRSPNW